MFGPVLSILGVAGCPLVFWGCVLTDYVVVEEEGGEVVRGRREAGGGSGAKKIKLHKSVQSPTDSDHM
jgi:hypothetical protein